MMNRCMIGKQLTVHSSSCIVPFRVVSQLRLWVNCTQSIFCFDSESIIPRFWHYSTDYVCTTKAPIQAPTSRPSSMPSISPTKLPTISPSKGPTKVPSKAPTNAPTGPCADSSTYEWTNDLGNTVDCDWLTKNSKQTRQRIGRWCEEANVSFACPITCETCTISCVDDETYKISLLNKKKDVFCSWISSNGVKEAQRRNMYCDKEGDRCPKSCGFCS